MSRLAYCSLLPSQLNGTAEGLPSSLSARQDADRSFTGPCTPILTEPVNPSASQPEYLLQIFFANGSKKHLGNKTGFYARNYLICALYSNNHIITGFFGDCEDAQRAHVPDIQFFRSYYSHRRIDFVIRFQCITAWRGVLALKLLLWNQNRDIAIGNQTNIPSNRA